MTWALKSGELIISVLTRTCATAVVGISV
jgi:hypothetical protein